MRKRYKCSMCGKEASRNPGQVVDALTPGGPNDSVRFRVHYSPVCFECHVGQGLLFVTPDFLERAVKAGVEYYRPGRPT